MITLKGSVYLLNGGIVNQRKADVFILYTVTRYITSFHCLSSVVVCMSAEGESAAERTLASPPAAAQYSSRIPAGVPTTGNQLPALLVQ